MSLLKLTEGRYGEARIVFVIHVAESLGNLVPHERQCGIFINVDTKLVHITTRLFLFGRQHRLRKRTRGLRPAFKLFEAGNLGELDDKVLKVLFGKVAEVEGLTSVLLHDDITVLDFDCKPQLPANPAELTDRPRWGFFAGTDIVGT